MVAWENCTSDDVVNFEKNIPVVGILAVFVVTGIVGNSLVLLIYGFRFKTSTTRVFILSLAAFDFITCVTLPYKMALLRYNNLYNQQPFQRAEVVRLYFLQVSVMLLPLVSIDRHRRICMPHKRQISPRVAKCMVLALCLVMASITIFRMVVSSQRHCYRAEAYISPEFVSEDLNSELREFYFAYMILPYVIPLPILVVSYSLIGLRVKQLDVHAVSNSSSCCCSPRNSKRSRIRLNLLSRKRMLNEHSGNEQRRKTTGEVVSESHSASNYILVGNSPASLTHCSSSENSLTSVSNEAARPYGTGMLTMSQRIQEEQRSKTSFAISRKVVALGGELEDTMKSSQHAHCEKTSLPYSQIAEHGLTHLGATEDVNNTSAVLESPERDTGYVGTSVKTYICGTTGPRGVQETRGSDLALDVRQRLGSGPRLRLKRMTLIFFLITLVYVTSCIPFLAIYLIFRVDYVTGHNMLSNGGFIVFYNSVYMSVVSNCFLYGFFDPRFRKELKATSAAFYERSSELCSFH